jgi:hypothetical protein
LEAKKNLLEEGLMQGEMMRLARVLSDVVCLAFQSLEFELELEFFSGFCKIMIYSTWLKRLQLGV